MTRPVHLLAAVAILALLWGVIDAFRPDVDLVRKPSTPPAPTAPHAASETTRPASTPALAAAADPQALSAAVSTLHAYLMLLPAQDFEAADAHWASARTDGSDRILRQAAGLGSMRIDSGRPIPLDRVQPPSALEIPVHLRLQTPQGPARLQGHYRLRLREDAQNWEITSASLEPVLD